VPQFGHSISVFSAGRASTNLPPGRHYANIKADGPLPTLHFHSPRLPRVRSLPSEAIVRYLRTFRDYLSVEAWPKRNIVIPYRDVITAQRPAPLIGASPWPAEVSIRGLVE
jgi:hypothetical protein